ncbi:MAG: hypothetical protein RL745_765 [Actinomycetota bacterium]
MGCAARSERVRRLMGSAVATVAAATAVLMAPAIADPGVSGDDSSDEYVGSEAILLSRQFDGGKTHRQQAAGCNGCRWRVTVLCPSDVALLDADPAAVIINPHPCISNSTTICPAGTRRLNVYFATSADVPLKRTGSGCFGPGGPVRKDWVHTWVRDVQRAKLPPAVLTLNPSTLVTGMTAVARIAPAAAHRWRMTVNRHEVVIAAQSKWRLEWGDQQTSWTTGNHASHRWHSPGVRTVVARGSWTARYWVDGDGPWPVPELITQQAQARAAVLSAAPRLVSWE